MSAEMCIPSGALMTANQLLPTNCEFDAVKGILEAARAC